ncbi:hypothetical protein HYC85_028912 [Camellia sinensis]|uniref:Uncharacterized protein n=1 Tax=Camellia sinensis TaxID=4442 RepID=A0A7J7FXN9_CAMSI|nr:hypothetical protein HYC85_028912 [Camellia sinensis]
MVTTTNTPRALAATPFTGVSGSSSQTAKYAPKGRRTFTLLYMPLSKALGVSIRKGHLKPLEPRPLPEKLPPSHNPVKYCAFHQQHDHETDQCYRLRHEIQDLADNRVIVAPEKLNVTTNPLPPHNYGRAPRASCFSTVRTHCHGPETLTRCLRPRVRHHQSCLGSGTWVRLEKSKSWDYKTSV